jgi:hypothetical protein
MGDNAGLNGASGNGPAIEGGALEPAAEDADAERIDDDDVVDNLLVKRIYHAARHYRQLERSSVLRPALWRDYEANEQAIAQMLIDAIAGEKMVLIPLQMDGHWTLVVIYTPYRQVTLFDEHDDPRRLERVMVKLRVINSIPVDGEIRSWNFSEGEPWRQGPITACDCAFLAAERARSLLKQL